MMVTEWRSVDKPEATRTGQASVDVAQWNLASTRVAIGGMIARWCQCGDGCDVHGLEARMLDARQAMAGLHFSSRSRIAARMSDHKALIGIVEEGLAAHGRGEVVLPAKAAKVPKRACSRLLPRLTLGLGQP
jgi:hypothetical protein